jgi:gliding motility-associated-like protein
MSRKLARTLYILVLIFSQPIYSQQQAWNWYFGDHAGISFSSGTPTAVVNSSMLAGEGCSSISDSTGNLLFYTDGISVYDAHHTLMPNGGGLTGGASSSQSAIIVKKPGSPKLYYIFTIDENFNNGLKGFRYSIVDMTLNGGLGDIGTGNKNVLIRDGVMERLTVAKHRNTSDFWVLITDFTDDKLLAYKLTCAGLETTPVKSDVGILYAGNWRSTFGYMKVSRQNDRIAMAGWDKQSFLVMDFNNATGAASNRIDITNPKIDNYTYGVEFSPNGKLLYGTTADGPRGLILNNLAMDTFRLFQFDLTSANATTIGNSCTILASHRSLAYMNYSFYFGALQVAPDGKIYSANPADTYLGVVQAPDVPGTNCNYVINGVDLKGRISGMGLPNMLADYALPKYDTVIKNTCTNGYAVLCDGTRITKNGVYICHVATPTACDSIIVTKVIVNRVDTTRLSAAVCAKQLPYIWQTGPITQAGQYFIRKNNSLGCDSVVVLNFSILPTTSSVIDTIICDGQSYLGHTNAGTYVDVFTGANGCDSTRTLHLFIKYPSTSETYKIICAGSSFWGYNKSGDYRDVLVAANGCDSIRMLHLTVQPAPIANAGPDITICVGQVADLQGSGGSTYSWRPVTYLNNATIANPRATPDTSITYTLTVTDGNGCTSQNNDKMTVRVVRPSIYIGSDTMITANEPLYLHAVDVNNNQFTKFKWSPATGLDDRNSKDPIAVLPPGVYSYTLTARTDKDCSATDDIKVTVFNTIDIYVPTGFSPNGDGKNDVLRPVLAGIKELKVFKVFDRWGAMIFHTNKPGEGWNGSRNGQQLVSGTYVWYAEGVDVLDRPIQRKGVTVLMR